MRGPKRTHKEAEKRKEKKHRSSGPKEKTRLLVLASRKRRAKLRPLFFPRARGSEEETRLIWSGREGTLQRRSGQRLFFLLFFFFFFFLLFFSMGRPKPWLREKENSVPVASYARSFASSSERESAKLVSSAVPGRKKASERESSEKKGKKQKPKNAYCVFFSFFFLNLDLDLFFFSSPCILSSRLSRPPLHSSSTQAPLSPTCSLQKPKQSERTTVEE